MSDYIENRLQIIGTDEEVSEIRNYIKSTDCTGQIQDIDFNKILKMPDTIQFTTSTLPLSYDFENATSEREKQQIIKKTNDINDRIYLNTKYNIFMYGCSDWTEWTYQNWGARYARSFNLTCLSPENTIYYQTPTRTALYVIQELSRIFPNVILILSYRAEYSGADFGELKFQDGKIICVMESDEIIDF